MWSHVNQSWAAGLLTGSLIAEAPVAGLLVCSWACVVLCPLAGFQPNKQTEQGGLGDGWSGGKSASSVNQMWLSLTPQATLVSSSRYQQGLFVRTNQLLLSTLYFLIHIFIIFIFHSWTLGSPCAIRKHKIVFVKVKSRCVIIIALRGR